MSGGQLRILAVEAFRDAFRRRVVTAVVIVTLCSLFVMDGCTSCVPANLDDMVVNGESLAELGVVSGLGIAIFCVIALWTVVLAGLLASDHLSSTLEDGSATLVLSKPVARNTFAVARLVGSLCVSLATSALLLAAAALFLYFRNGLPLPPAVLAGVMALGGCVVMAALSMLCSLFVNRIATLLFIVTLAVAVIVANLLSIFGIEANVAFDLLDRWGPPLGSSIAVALAPWRGIEVPGLVLLGIGFRLVIWIAIAVSALVIRFRRLEIPT